MFHAAALALALVVSTVHAQEAVDLTLLLAVDTSESIDEAAYGVMHRGYVEALRDPTVWAVVERCAPGGLALGYAEWSARRLKYDDPGFMVEPFVRIDSAAALHAFADRLAAHARSNHGILTDIGGALVDAVTALESAPFTAERRVVDLGTDGLQDDKIFPAGFESADAWLAFARAQAIDRDVTINALVLDRYGITYNFGKDLEGYFQTRITGGRDTFTIKIDKVEDVREALVRKLRREICPVSA